MKHPRTLIAVLALFLLLPSAAASAQSEKPLTERELEKFIADWPAVVEWFESKGRQLDSASAANAAAALFVGNDYAAFIRRKGWAEDRFAHVAGTVFWLTAYVGFEKQNPDMLKQFDEAAAQIRATAGMSAADKAEALRGIEEAKKALLALPEEAKVDEAELKLVRGRYDRLLKVLDASR